jgi:hypothetical protein
MLSFILFSVKKFACVIFLLFHFSVISALVNDFQSITSLKKFSHSFEVLQTSDANIVIQVLLSKIANSCKPDNIV